MIIGVLVLISADLLLLRVAKMIENTPRFLEGEAIPLSVGLMGFIVAFVVHCVATMPLALVCGLHTNNLHPLAIGIFVVTGMVPLTAYGRLLMFSLSFATAGQFFSTAVDQVTYHDYSRARFLAREGNIHGAVAEYRRYFLHDASTPAPLFEAARLLVREKQPERAVELLNEAVLAFREQRYLWAQASYQLAEVYEYHLNQPDEAIAMLQRIVQRVPTSEYGELARDRLGPENDPWRSPYHVESDKDL